MDSPREWTFVTNCISCNALVPISDSQTKRAICPRCAESFAVSPATIREASLEERNEVQRTSQKTPTTASPNRRLFIGGAVAVVALLAGLAIFRPWNSGSDADSRGSRTDDSGRAPLEWEGIRYLPASTNLIVGMRPDAVSTYARQTEQDPKKIWDSLGLPAAITGFMKQAGLSWDQIDAVVIGLTLSDEVLPTLMAVLRLKQPLPDEEKFLKQMKAEKKATAGRAVYTLGTGIPLVMTRVDKRMYLLSLTDTAFAGVDQPQPVGGTHLPPQLQANLRERLPAPVWFWFASDSDNWSEKPGLKLTMKKEQLAKLAPGRAAVMGLSFDPDPRMDLAIQLKDATATEATKNALTSIGQRVSPQSRVVVVENWVTAESPYDITKTQDLIRNLFSDLTGK